MTLSNSRSHRRALILALIVGLYLGRVVAETSAQPWRAWALALVVLGGLLLGWLVVRLLGVARWDAFPLAILMVYVAWPWAHPSLAAGVAVAAAAGLIVWNGQAPQRAAWWVEVAVLLGALALYVGTLAPSVLPADAGEFQLVGAVLGIAHPPGYPLYTLLAHAFTLLPLGDVAYRVNLFAAACGALALAVLAWGVRRETGSAAGALVAAGALGLSSTFWAQSTTANVRGLTALFTALCLALLLRWGQTRRQRDLVSAAACFGLGVGHHGSLGLLGVPFLAYVVASEPSLILRPRQWLPAVGAGLATLLVLLYLPLRSAMGTPFDPAPIRSLDDFLGHVLAAGFRGDMLYFRTAPELAARSRIGLQILRLQFGPIVLLAALGAAGLVAARRGRALLLLGGAWLVNVLSALTYRAPQTVEYLIPSYVALAFLLGLGIGLLPAAGRSRAWRAGATAVLAMAVIAVGARNLPSMRVLSADTSTRGKAVALLEAAPEGALILANWHRATPLWYLQRVEGLRPDVEVQYVYPEGALSNDAVWLRRIGEAVDRRPVLVTNRFHAFDQTDYRWVPFYGAWLVAGEGRVEYNVALRRVARSEDRRNVGQAAGLADERRESLTELSQAIIPREATFGGELRLLGYYLAADTLSPGGTVDLQVYWQVARAPSRDYTAFAQLIGPQGVVGQGDLPHRTTRYLPGEVRVDAYRFPLLLHVPPGEYTLITGFYYGVDGGWRRLEAGGADHVTLTSVTVLPAEGAPATLHAVNRAFAGGLRLVGVDYDAGVPGQGRLYLHWERDPVTLLDLGPWRPSMGTATVRALRGDGVIATAPLPALPPGSAATVALDLPLADGEALHIDVLGADGVTLPALGPWHRPARGGVRLRAPTEGERYVPLGGKMAFIGLAETPPTARPGEDLWLRPRFLALRPLTVDNSVSVGLARPDLGWEQKTDGIPALGAIPTLKWVRGWRVEDLHALRLALDAPTGPAAITVTVYDAFTLAPLQVLDERLARDGQGIQFQVGDIEVTP